MAEHPRILSFGLRRLLGWAVWLPLGVIALLVSVACWQFAQGVRLSRWQARSDEQLQAVEELLRAAAAGDGAPPGARVEPLFARLAEWARDDDPPTRRLVGEARRHWEEWRHAGGGPGGGAPLRADGDALRAAAYRQRQVRRARFSAASEQALALAVGAGVLTALFLATFLRRRLRSVHGNYRRAVGLAQARAQALAASEQRHRLAIDGARLGTWSNPLPLGRLVWNVRCKEHFWMAPDEEPDIARFYAVLHPADREPVRRAIDEALAGRGLFDAEYRTVAPDGRVRWVRAIGRGLYDQDGWPHHFDGITIDITDRKAETASLLEAKQQAEAANLAKDEFLATVSHELRSPLNAILGWTQLLRLDPATRERQWEEGLAVIERSTRAQVRLIGDLLDVSRIVSGKLRLDVRRVALDQVVAAALESLRPAAAARELDVSARLDPGVGPVAGDPERLQQVFWNLLSNAIKFTPRGGRVQVALSQRDAHAEIVVSDTGRGIAPDFLPHVFERFSQAEGGSTRGHQGLGLGLAICRHLVELHGGSIQADSDGERQGARFTVRLPLVAPGGTTAGGQNHRGAPASSGLADGAAPSLAGVHALVVDDEPDSRRLVASLLAFQRAEVTQAANAAEAFAAVQRRRPDVLLCDIRMSGEDGYQLIRRIRALGPERGGDVPAAALTAYVRDEDRALRAGFQLHLAKPFEAAELIAAVTRLTGRG